MHKVERMAGTSASWGVCMLEHRLSQALMLAEIKLEIPRPLCMHQAGAARAGHLTALLTTLLAAQLSGALADPGHHACEGCLAPWLRRACARRARGCHVS